MKAPRRTSKSAPQRKRTRQTKEKNPVNDPLFSGGALHGEVHKAQDGRETYPVREWMAHDFDAKPALNEHELTSIAALITYVAHMTKHHTFNVERRFADRFNIPNVSCLPSERYDDAIRYLVDQIPAETPKSC